MATSSAPNRRPGFDEDTKSRWSALWWLLPFLAVSILVVVVVFGVRSPPTGLDLRSDEWTPGDRIELPSDEFMPLYTDLRGVHYEAAVDRALAACVASHGLTLDVPDRGDSAPDLHLRRYGILDPAEAMKRGYKLAADPRSEELTNYTQQLTAEQIDAIGDPEDATSCVSQVRRSIGADEDPRWEDVAVVVELQQASFQHARSQPAVQEADHRWSACVRNATGFSPPSVVEAAALGLDGDYGEHEVEVALADIRCKESTGVVDAYLAAETEFQLRRIDAHRELFARALGLQTELFVLADDTAGR